jgi:uncharacterized phage-associated protein
MLRMQNNSPGPSRAVLQLTDWIRATASERPDPLTHLKLQKLSYYCYGALLAFDCEHLIGHIEFQAWKHGPVSPEIYALYQRFGKNPIGRAHKPTVQPIAELHLNDVMNVFGRMTAWQLREESHIEKTPWSNIYNGAYNQVISEVLLRKHFRVMFKESVHFPEKLFGSSSLELDRIPVPKFRSLHEMSLAVSRILGDA